MKLMMFVSCVLFFLSSCISTAPGRGSSQQRPVYHQPRPLPRPEVIRDSSHPTQATQVPTTNLENPIQNQNSSQSPLFDRQSVQASTDTIRNEILTVLKMPNLSKDRTLQIIENQMNIETVETALNDPQLQHIRPQLLMKYGKLLQKNRNYSGAADAYKALLSQFPQSSLASLARQQHDLMIALDNTNPFAVGAILPLTGKNANVGQHALNAIKMGLGIADNNITSKYQLFVFDNQSQPQISGAGVQKLILDYKVIGIIGGLSSKEATTIAETSDLLSVPFVALTQKSGLTNIGDFIFRNALTPEMQVSRLVQYAIEKLNAKRFAVLYPNDSYGVEFANTYWDEVLRQGAQITAAQTYDPKINDFTGVVQKLVGTYYPEARKAEYDERVENMKKAMREREKKLKKENKKIVKNSREHQVQENVLPPIVDFDVLFIPDTGKALSQVISFMKVNDVSGLTYLGTNIWNTPDVIRRSSGQKDRIFFTGVMDQTDPEFKSLPFYKEYFSFFNEEPTLIEIQAYEAGKILRTQLQAGADSRNSLVARLRSTGRIPGVGADLTLNESREFVRPVRLFTAESGSLKKIE